MIVAFNPIFNWTNVKFFESEYDAKCWTEYLMLQTNYMIEDERNDGRSS